MSLSTKSTLILCLSFFLLFTISNSSLEILLRNKGLPGGLFPKSVKSYDFDLYTGRLEVHLESSCMARFENRVFFDKVVRANLTYGRLVELEGVTQEELFLWLPVKEIIVDNDPGFILIDIGYAHKQFSFYQFDEPYVCKRHRTPFCRDKFLCVCLFTSWIQSYGGNAWNSEELILMQMKMGRKMGIQAQR
ncbi:hypothetical protein Dsin_027757 [Dipteronia sinensis]|uniref:Transmembrane protein n=1 Tax=Dipteronia sinensis TaxID=43782 RepID=A0AAD9ZQZ5_9ROSI|nr:hypothetical protein Dsin_027757 [Dipteronia sinensis]